MEPIYSMATLQRSPSQVKDAIRDSIVRITEQGAAAYVFYSEETFEQRIVAEREDAAFEARLMESVGRGVGDIEAGCFVTSVEEAFDRADALRGKRA